MRSAFLLPAIVLALAPVALTVPRPAYACSAGVDFDPVASSEMVVSGQMIGWEPVASPPGNPPRPQTFQTIRATLEVESVLRGTAPSRVVFLDTASLLRDAPPGANRWAGSSGACGAFNEDPTGKYMILGLSRAQDGTLRSGLLTVLLIGDRAGPLDTPPYDRLRRELSATQMDGLNLTPKPPTIGSLIPPATGSAGLLAANLKE